MEESIYNTPHSNEDENKDRDNAPPVSRHGTFFKAPNSTLDFSAYLSKQLSESKRLNDAALERSAPFTTAYNTLWGQIQENFAAHIPEESTDELINEEIKIDDEQSISSSKYTFPNNGEKYEKDLALTNELYEKTLTLVNEFAEEPQAAVIFSKRGNIIYASLCVGAAVVSTISIAYGSFYGIMKIVTGREFIPPDELEAAVSSGIIAVGLVSAILAMFAQFPFTGLYLFGLKNKMFPAKEDTKGRKLAVVYWLGALTVGSASSAQNTYITNVALSNVIGNSGGLFGEVMITVTTFIALIGAGIGNLGSSFALGKYQYNRDYHAFSKMFGDLGAILSPFFERMRTSRLQLLPTFADDSQEQAPLLSPVLDKKTPTQKEAPTRKEMLAALKYRLNSAVGGYNLGLNDQEIKQTFEKIFPEQKGKSSFTLDDVVIYLKDACNKYPSIKEPLRLLLQYTVGLVIIGYFGNVNYLHLGYEGGQALAAFLNFPSALEVLFGAGCGLCAFLLNLLTNMFAGTQGFFDVLFRMGKQQHSDLSLMANILAVVPALMIAVSQVLITSLNHSISGFEKTLVLTSSIVTCLVLSRAGIIGGCKEVFDLFSNRDRLTNAGGKMYEQFEKMKPEHLAAVYNMLTPFFEKLDKDELELKDTEEQGFAARSPCTII